MSSRRRVADQPAVVGPKESGVGRAHGNRDTQCGAVCSYRRDEDLPRKRSLDRLQESAHLGPDQTA
jgi:hypothetical protein